MSKEKEDKMLQKKEDWRFYVELWIKALDFFENENKGRGYLLFEKLRDVKEKGVGEKINVTAQNFW